MTKVTDKIRDLVDPHHKGFKHTLLFKVLIGLALLIILGIIYNVFIRRSTTADMTDDQKEQDAARKAALDTIDVVGDYLWPEDKPAPSKDDEKKDEEEEKPVEHAKEQPVAEAATEEDIENATGETTGKTEETTTAEPSAEKKTDAPKVEKMDKPTVEEIE